MSPEQHQRASAKHMGLTLEAYRARLAAGERWCTGCRTLHLRDAFGPDRSRNDGLNRKCKESARRSWEAWHARHRAGLPPRARVLDLVLEKLSRREPHAEIEAFIRGSL